MEKRRNRFVLYVKVQEQAQSEQIKDLKQLNDISSLTIFFYRQHNRLLISAIYS